MCWSSDIDGRSEMDADAQQGIGEMQKGHGLAHNPHSSQWVETSVYLYGPQRLKMVWN